MRIQEKVYLCKLLILLFSDRVTDVTDKYNDFPCVRACVRTHGTFQNISVTSVTLSPSYIIFGGSGEAVPIAIRSDRISSAERPFPSLYYSSSRLLVKRTSFSRPTLQRYKITTTLPRPSTRYDYTNRTILCQKPAKSKKNTHIWLISDRK